MSDSVANRKSIFALLIFVLLPIASAIGAISAWPEFRWRQHQLHSAIEAITAMAAIVVALLLNLLKTYRQFTPRMVWIVCALLSLGILGSLHAFVQPSDTFTWLRSLATLLGGACLALIWLPDRVSLAPWTRRLPWVVTATTASLGALAILAPETIPPMIQGEAFTLTALLLNTAGGLCFILATVKLLIEYHTHGKSEDLLLSALCLLFGAAGVTFYFSRPWDFAWWLWHGINLTAALVALRHFFALTKEREEAFEQELFERMKAEEALSQAAAQLERRVQERTLELTDTNRKLQGEVAERRQVEAALRQSEARLTAVNECSPLGIFVTDDQGVCLYTNPAFQVISGLSPEEARADGWQKALHPDDRERVAVEWERAAREQTPIASTHRFLHKDGRKVWTRVQAATMRDGDAVLGYVGSVEDITARKAAEEALRVSEERYQLAVQGSSDGLWDWNVLTDEVYYSTRFKTLLGYEDHEFAPVLESFYSRLHPDDAPAVTKAIRAHLERREPYDVDYRLRTKSNEDRWFRARGQAIWNASGQPIRMAGSLTDITEHRRTAHALQEQEAFLKSAQALAHLGSWEWDIGSGAEHWSDEQFRIFGYRPNESVPTYETFQTALHPGDRARVLSAIDATVNQGKHYDIECRIMRPDGTERLVHCRGNVVRSPEGQAVKMTGTVLDVTERKRAEDERAQMVTVIEASLNEIYIFDAHTLRFIYANQGALTNLGYTLDTLQRMTTLEVKPNFTETDFRRLLDPLRTGQQQRLVFETIHQRADGTRYPVEAYLQLVNRGGGQAFLAVIHDISERKRAEEKFKLLVEAAPNGILLVGQDGTIRLVNAQVEHMFGYHREELLGQPIERLVPDQAKRSHPGHRADFFHKPAARPMGIGRDLSGQRKDGSLIPVEIGLTPLDSQEGPQVLVSVTDISERKAAEQTLAHHVQELTRSNAELEQFAYVSSHDLQEPLRMVSSYCGLLQKRYRGKLDADADEFIAFAVDGARRMKQLIEDLLAYSRIQTQGAAFAPVSCEEMVRAALDNLRLAIEESGAVVTYDSLPTVNADRAQLSRVFPEPDWQRRQVPRGRASSDSYLLRLAGNGDEERPLANRHPRQRDRIRSAICRPHLCHIPTTPHARPVSRHRNGPGDLQEDRRTPRRDDLGGIVPRPRQYLHPHDTRTNEERENRHAARGHPDFRSGRGPGRAIRKQSANARLLTEDFMVHVETNDLINILLVEDNPGDVRLTQEALTEGRVASRLHVVRDGMQALDFLFHRAPYTDSPHPDLILLDLNLPRKNGHEVLAAIKADQALKHIPVIMLTSSKADQDVVKSYDLSVNCYVTKPVELPDFLNAVKQIEDFWLTIVRLPHRMN